MTLSSSTSTFLGLIITTLPLVSLAAIIQPVALVSEEYVYTSATTMIDSQGMIQAVNSHSTLNNALKARHCFDEFFSDSYVSMDPGGTPSDLFKSLPDGDTDIDLVFDLTGGGGDTTVRTALIWQYQNIGDDAVSVGNSTRTLEIRVNTEAQGKETFSGPATLITLKPVTDGDKDPSNDLGGTNSAQTFQLHQATKQGRYVQISITDNYLGHQGITGGGDRVGLGEIRFSSEKISSTKTAPPSSKKVQPPSKNTQPGAAIIGLGGISVILLEKP